MLKAVNNDLHSMLTTSTINKIGDGHYDDKSKNIKFSNYFNCIIANKGNQNTLKPLSDLNETFNENYFEVNVQMITKACSYQCL